MLIASLIRYAEDKRFFPDETPAVFDAIDDLWRSYSGNLGDVTFWGPRDRLRCRNMSISGGGGSALVVGGTAGRRRELSRETEGRHQRRQPRVGRRAACYSDNEQ
jgi:hypothetical protein